VTAGAEPALARRVRRMAEACATETAMGTHHWRHSWCSGPGSIRAGGWFVCIAGAEAVDSRPAVRRGVSDLAGVATEVLAAADYGRFLVVPAEWTPAVVGRAERLVSSAPPGTPRPSGDSAG